jgi:hypothetical protein
VVHKGITKQVSAVLTGLHLPHVRLGNRDLKISDPIMIPKPEILPPLILTIPGKYGVKEEDDAVTSQPRQITLGRLGSD